MPQARSSAVRSHRRGGARRRNIGPWIVVPLVLVLVGSGLTAGYIWIDKQTCSGEAKAKIVAPPGTAALLKTLATQWQDTNPQVEDGTCAEVDVSEQDTVETMTALSQKWEPAMGPGPDVWVPPSSAWARAVAANSEIADLLLPDRLPSVARSPVVIAMPKALATKFGWPKIEMDWKDLVDKFQAQPEIKVGMSNPSTSTAGLLALSSVIDANDDTEVTVAELARVHAVAQAIAFSNDTTDGLLAEYVKNKGQTLTAFPALEQDVVKHNEAHPELPLVAIYPTNATTEADHPYMILQNAEWAAKDRMAAASAFLDYVRSDAGRATVKAQGFRDSNRIGGAQLTEDKGVLAKLTALPRGVLLADSIAKTVNRWTALKRPTNMLLLLDVSGSMRGTVLGTGQTKLDLTRAAAKQALSMFADTASVGLWSFSANRGGTDYQQLVAPGKLSDTVGGQGRREKLVKELNALKPGGNTPMYTSVWAAYQAMQKSYVADADNILVVLTDGADDDQGKGITLKQLTDQMKTADKNKPVKVVTIALGKEGNSEALKAISTASGVTGTYSSKRSYNIEQILLAAIFNF